MRARIRLLTLAILAAFSQPSSRGETEGEAKPRIESPSPDGRFSFRYTPESEAKGKSYDLISRNSGKALARVAEADVDPGPSERFAMAVLWRHDSKAFALTATLWKRGSYVSVYLRDGSTFREIELPELLADIPEKVKKGKEFPHIAELNSQSAKRWQKDGSLAVEIENIQDGNGSSITATRNVVLSFGPSGRARIVKSTIKFATETGCSR